MKKFKQELYWIIAMLLVGFIAMTFLIRAERELQDVYTTCNDHWREQVEVACPVPQRSPTFEGWEDFTFITPGDLG